MITLDVPPKLILPDHYQSNRPAIIRPGVDPANFFPVEIDRKTRRAIVSKLAKLGLTDDRAEAVKMVDAAILFGMFKVGAKPPAAFTYSVYNASGTSFAGVNFGTAHSKRLIVVVMGTLNTNDATACTIGGISATNVVTLDDNPMVCQIFSAAVPTGTSGTITFTKGSDDTYISVYSIYPDSATATATNSSATASTPVTMTLAVTSGGVSIFGIQDRGSNAFTGTWSGATGTLTEYADDANGSRRYGSWGILSGITAGATGTISIAKNANSTSCATVGASWGA